MPVRRSEPGGRSAIRSANGRLERVADAVYEVLVRGRHGQNNRDEAHGESKCVDAHLLLPQINRSHPLPIDLCLTLYPAIRS